MSHLTDVTERAAMLLAHAEEKGVQLTIIQIDGKPRIVVEETTPKEVPAATLLQLVRRYTCN